jgi:hypothetical protein
VKKVIALTILAIGVLAVSCDRQKALDKIMADPQMKTYIMGELLQSEATKAQLADSVFADRQIMDSYLNNLVSNEITRTDLLNRIIKTDTTGNWIFDKLSADPDFAARIKPEKKK